MGSDVYFSFHFGLVRRIFLPRQDLRGGVELSYFSSYLGLARFFTSAKLSSTPNEGLYAVYFRAGTRVRELFSFFFAEKGVISQ